MTNTRSINEQVSYIKECGRLQCNSCQLLDKIHTKKNSVEACAMLNNLQKQFSRFRNRLVTQESYLPVQTESSASVIPNAMKRMEDKTTILRLK